MESSTLDASDPSPLSVVASHEVGRRRFLTYLVAGSTLTLSAGWGLSAAGALPRQPGPSDVIDLGEILIAAAAPTSLLLTLEVLEDGTVDFSLPREEVGQGITTSVGMLVAEEMDLPLSSVRVRLDPARPELLYNQLTGGSNTIRALYEPVRLVSAAARAALVAAAAGQLGTAQSALTTRDGRVHAADGRSLGYGELSAAASALGLANLRVAPKRAADAALVGTPQSRTDARDMVTGRLKYTLDQDVPGAKPVVLRRPPTLRGTVVSVDDSAAKAMPGVLGVAVLPTGVAVMAETFGEAIAAKDALRVEWGAGTVDRYSDTEVRDQLRAATLPFTATAAGALPLVGAEVIEDEFDHLSVSHAPMETNSAIADVREDGATVWAGLKSPINAQEEIALALGMTPSQVVVNVVQAGGSFGRRLFHDAALEAALASRAFGRPAKLMWTRVDDMRHGRVRPAMHHKLRAVIVNGEVVAYEQRVASVETDYRHGLGEILTQYGAGTPGGRYTFAQTVFNHTVKCPYALGTVNHLLNEVPLQMNTGAYRSVYSPNTRGAEEMFIDVLAERLGKDPVAYRRELLQDPRQQRLLDEVSSRGLWGRTMPAGFAQGFGYHEEYASLTACLVELDARDPAKPRVVKAVMGCDVGTPVNPRGLEAMMIGGLTDAIATTLRAGLHLDRGLPLEGSYSQFHYARQDDSPFEVEVVVMPRTEGTKIGGAGELALAAAVGAIGNAYARATGTRPRSFPIDDTVDFTPFPR